MPLIDDRGRLFGKVNLFDAIVGAVLLGLIPIVYGAFLLFRVPAPTITAVVPAELEAEKPATVQLTGQDLRPFLRAQIGMFESSAFLVQSPTIAEIKVPPLPPGTYDIVLSDQGQELVRKTGVLTVVAPPAPGAPAAPVVPDVPRLEVQLIGAFAVTTPDIPSFDVGATFEMAGLEKPLATVLAVRPAEAATRRVRLGTDAFLTMRLPGQLRIPAILAVNCAVIDADCTIGNARVMPNASITLPMKDQPSGISFVIDEIRPADTPPLFPVPGPPPTEPVYVALQLVGTFVGLTADDARLINVGATMEPPPAAPRLETAASAARIEPPPGPVAEILAVKAPQPGVQRIRGGSGIVSTPGRDIRVAAIIRINCRLVDDTCRVGETNVAPNQTVSLPLSRRRDARFTIDEIRSPDARAVFPGPKPLATLRVRFVTNPEVRDVMKAGDRDVGGWTEPDGDRAVLLEIGTDGQQLTALTSTGAMQVEQTVIAFTGTVRVPVSLTAAGWIYRERPVRVGAPFTFESTLGTMVGTVIDMKVDAGMEVTTP